MSDLNIDIDAILRTVRERQRHQYVNPWAGLPSLLQPIGAPCGQCGAPGGDPIHRAAPADTTEDKDA